DARADPDPAQLPEPVRPDPRGRSRLPPRHPPADRARDAPGVRRVRREGARPRRSSGLCPRLPPVRRRRLGRLPLPVDVLDTRLRAHHGPHSPAPALAPDLPAPALRHLLVLPAPPRLRPGGGADPLPPLEPAVGGDDLLHVMKLRIAHGVLGRAYDALSYG